MNANLIKNLTELSKIFYPEKFYDMTSKLKENGIDIIDSGGDKIGNCYHSNCYTVTSNELLSKEFIISLRDFGLLGYGQEFYIRQEQLKDNKYVVKIVNYVDSSD